MTANASTQLHAQLHPTARPRRLGRSAWLLGLVLIVAALLRLHAIGREAFGFDELFSVHFATARGPWETALPAEQWMNPAINLQSIRDAPTWWHIWTSMAYDTHPPLHSLVLRAWLAVMGESDVKTRLLSVVCSLACISLLFDAARVAGGARAGLWAAGIAAVMASQIQYAQEVRSYVMLSMLAGALLSAGARLLVRGGSWPRHIAFAAIVLAMMLTHYFAVGAIVPVAAVIFAFIDRRSRGIMLVCCTIAAVVFAIAWGPFLLEQRTNFIANMGWIADDEPGLLLRSIRRAAVVPIRLLFDPGADLIQAADGGRNLLWAAPLLLLIVPTALGARAKVTWMFLAAVIGPIALAAVTDVWQHRQALNLIRYTLPAGAGLCCLLAVAGTARSPLLANLLPAAAVLGCLGALPRAWDGDKPLWRDYVQGASEGLQANDAIVLLRERGREWAGALVYMALSRYMPTIDCPVIVLDAPAPRTLIDRLRQRRRIVILSEAASPPIEKYLPGLPSAIDPTWIPYTGSYARMEVAGAAPPTATSPAADP